MMQASQFCSFLQIASLGVVVGGNFHDSALKYLNTFNMIVLETVSYIFLGVAMMRLEPAMKIEIIISFSRCLIRANVHIFQENRDWKLNPH